MTLLHIAFLLIAVGLLPVGRGAARPVRLLFRGGHPRRHCRGDHGVPVRADLYIGWLTLVGVFVVVPLLTSLLVRLWPHTPLGRRSSCMGRTRTTLSPRCP